MARDRQAFPARSTLRKRNILSLFLKSGAAGAARFDLHPRFAEFDEDIALQFSAVKTEFRFGVEITTLDEVADFQRRLHCNRRRRQLIRIKGKLESRAPDHV